MKWRRDKCCAWCASFVGVLCAFSVAGCGGGPKILGYDAYDNNDVEKWVFDTSTKDESQGRDRGGSFIDTSQDWSSDLPDRTAQLDEDILDDTQAPLLPYEFIPDRQYRDALFSVLSQAKEEVLMLELEFYSDKGDVANIAEKLKSLASSGVKVRVLVERDVQENSATVQALKAGGADARLDNSKISLHTKLVVVDGKVALVGSTNLSNASSLYNHEANYLITDPDAVTAIRQYALNVLQNENRLYPIGFSGSGDVIPFSDGEYTDVVMPNIEGAQEKVYLVMYDFNTSAEPAYTIAQKLIDARKRGVDVKVILERSNFDQSLTRRNQEAMSLLCKGGIPTKFDSADVTTHAKLLITERVVVVYSGNFNQAGLEENHETGVIVPYDEKAVTYFEGLFQSAGSECTM